MVKMFLTFVIHCDSIEQFLDYWSARYHDPRDGEKYDPFVGKLPLTEESRRELFEWKNGSALSRRKLMSIADHYPLSVEPETLCQYLRPSAHGGAIWNIFYAHCVDPQTWPIFDQHTYRAMYFMNKAEFREIPPRKADVYDAYKTEYIPFVKGLNADQRKIDKALYSFGQFLKLAKPYC
jgi:hypothetical protein